MKENKESGVKIVCGGYNADEELYVYDQSCANCANNGGCSCPMYLDADEERAKVIKATEKKRREDAIVRAGEPEWCIYWRAKGKHKY